MKGSRAAPQSQKPMPEGGGPKKTLISIVDDEESVREATKGLMRSLGFTAEAFPSAEDFLKSNNRCRTGCLIADVQMPGMTGLDLHSQLAASGEHTPTILISAYPDERMRARVLQKGVICYLTKPFTEDELLACIHWAFGESGASGKT